MISHGVGISIAGGVGEMVRETQTHTFFFFFYHVFIVSKYKKLRAALAMEKTKPINQNKQQRKPYYSLPPLRRRSGKPFAITFHVSTNDRMFIVKNHNFHLPQI